MGTGTFINQHLGKIDAVKQFEINLSNLSGGINTNLALRVSA